METLEDAFEYDRAIVVGIGGSADVVGAVPTARLLDLHGVETILGGVAWEPAPEDPVVGPRSLDELTAIERASATVGLADGETTIENGVPLSETGVAAHFDEPVAVLDVTEGLDGLVAGLAAACETLDVDLVVGTDSGGDVLARGDEPGLRSPVTDGLGLAALVELDRPTMLGVFGYGSDGELTREELDAGLARVAERDGLLGAWGLSPSVRDELDDVLERVNTEASRLPVEAASGAVGEREIRGGEVTLQLSPVSTVTFYVDPDAAAATSDPTAVVREARDLDAIRTAFRERGLPTEFQREAERLDRAESR